jgi:hypothetical protein
MRDLVDEDYLTDAFLKSNMERSCCFGFYHLVSNSLSWKSAYGDAGTIQKLATTIEEKIYYTIKEHSNFTRGQT